MLRPRTPSRAHRFDLGPPFAVVGILKAALVINYPLPIVSPGSAIAGVYADSNTRLMYVKQIDQPLRLEGDLQAMRCVDNNHLHEHQASPAPSRSSGIPGGYRLGCPRLQVQVLPESELTTPTQADIQRNASPLELRREET